MKPFVSVKEDFSLVEKSPLVISAFFGNVSFRKFVTIAMNACTKTIHFRLVGKKSLILNRCHSLRSIARKLSLFHC